MSCRFGLLVLFVWFNVFIDTMGNNIEPADSISPTDNDSTMIVIPDSDFISNLDSIIIEYEKTHLIQKAIIDYENTLLKKEMSFKLNSSTTLLKGLFLSSTNRRFRNRNAIFEHHKSNDIDYLPALSPLATTWGLKAFGLKSRSKTKRMALSNSLALGIGLSTAKLMKSSISANRPDAYNNHSMPSGHATIAFISASILDREYGHYSPWISVGAYATAFATQFHRIHQNAHYLNDVVVGAGIGVVSTNLAYYLTDCILGQKQINRPFVSNGDIIQYNKFLNKPTSIALYSNTETGYNKIDVNDYSVMLERPYNFTLRSTSSLGAALEYDFFFNSSFSLETIFRLTQTKVQVLDNITSNPTVFGNNIYQYHFDIGLKYSVLVGLEKRIAFRAFVGDRYVPKTIFNSVEYGNPVICLFNTNSFEVGGGISVDMLSNSKYISGLSCDYTHAFSSLFQNRWVIGTYFKIIL